MGSVMKTSATGFLLAMCCALTGACGGQTAQDDPAPTLGSDAAVYHFDSNWGSGLGCSVKGDDLVLTGTIVVQPFGKGSDGALLKTDDDEWVLSYRAEGALLELRDKRVVAHGHACDKQGEAVGGKHFDLKTLTEAS